MRCKEGGVSRRVTSNSGVSSLIFIIITLLIAIEFTSCFQVRNKCRQRDVPLLAVAPQNRNSELLCGTSSGTFYQGSKTIDDCDNISYSRATLTDRDSFQRRRLMFSFLSFSAASVLGNPRELDALDTKAAVSSTSTTTATTTSSAAAAFSTSDLAKLLHNVPTFTIVDTTGVPFFVFGEDAKLTSYFFTSYEEAERILSLARQSSEKAITDTIAEMKEKARVARKANNGKQDSAMDDERTVMNEGGSNPWKDARISVIPLDTAVTLASVASSNKGSGVHFQIAPAKQDIEDAMELEKINDLVEGKVPIFYFEEFDVPMNKLQTSKNNIEIMDYTPDAIVTPLYFQKSQLISEWVRINPNKEVPPVKTTDLFATLVKMVQPNSSKKDVKELQKLVFIPPQSSAQRAKDCIQNGQNMEPYRLDQRIIVM
jgi:hypothetical protein